MNRPTNEDLNRAIEQIKNQMSETGKLLQEARAEVERLKTALRDVAERQREACADAVGQIETDYDAVKYDDNAAQKENTMSKNDTRSVVTDMELENGIFKEGAKYYIRTPSLHYIGTLRAVTPTVFLFTATATVYESGTYKEFFSGGGKDIQPHEGAGDMVVDRAGTVLIEMR